MQFNGIHSARRLFSIAGCLILSIYIIRTDFDLIPSTILFASACFYLTVSIDLFFARKEMQTIQNNHTSSKKEILKNYYSNEANLNIAFADCLEKAVHANQNNRRISKILDNYQVHNHRFKLNLKRPSEKRLDPNIFNE